MADQSNGQRKESAIERYLKDNTPWNPRRVAIKDGRYNSPGRSELTAEDIDRAMAQMSKHMEKHQSIYYIHHLQVQPC